MPLRQISGDGNGLRFDDIPPGRYAIQLFVDSNGNGQLDVSPRGIPLEPVGFSGNPGLLKGRPDAQACSFEHGEIDSQIAIQLRQRRQAAPAAPLSSGDGSSQDDSPRQISSPTS